MARVAKFPSCCGVRIVHALDHDSLVHSLNRINKDWKNSKKRVIAITADYQHYARKLLKKDGWKILGRSWTSRHTRNTLTMYYKDMPFIYDNGR